MKMIAATTGFLFALGFLGRADAKTWTIDASHSRVGFSVSHMMVSKTKGRFKGVEGTVELHDKDLTKSRIEVSLDVATLDTDNEKRDDHLKGKDFFDVAKHKQIRFKSKRITANKGRYRVYGDLTIRGVTKPVTLDTKITAAVKSPWGGLVRGVHATARVNRQDFGIRWNKGLDKGGVVVGNEVDIEIDVEITPKK